MKLSETLAGIGRPMAYYPGLRKITGSTTATILLCQLFYWTGKEAAGDGWIYKTSEELTEETGLSYDEQVTARKHLVERDLIEERYARLEHKMYFRVCIETLNTVWEIHETGNAKMGKDETTNSTKQALPKSLNRIAETTRETTLAEKKHGAKTAPKQPLENLSIENQIFAGVKKITMPTNDDWFEKAHDAARLFSLVDASLEPLAFATIDALKIIPSKRDVKGWAGALRELKVAGVTEEIIRAAADKLREGGMTIADPYSLRKTALALAAKPKVQKVEYDYVY